LTKAAALDRKATGHGIVVLGTVVLVNAARETPARRSVGLGMLALRDGDRKDEMVVRETPGLRVAHVRKVLRRVVLGTLVRLAAGVRKGLARKVVMVVREVNVVPKVDRNTVREDLRLAVPDRSTVDHSLVRRVVQKVDVGARADVVLLGLRVSMAGRHAVVTIAVVDLVVLRRSLDEVRPAVRRRS
jgi:hypothetical protein